MRNIRKALDLMNMAAKNNIKMSLDMALELTDDAEREVASQELAIIYPNPFKCDPERKGLHIVSR